MSLSLEKAEAEVVLRMVGGGEGEEDSRISLFLSPGESGPAMVGGEGERGSMVLDDMVVVCERARVCA